MSIREFLQTIVDRDYVAEWTNPDICISPECSMGNYDDVFEDGVRLGQHYAAEKIKKYLESNPEEPS